MDIGILILIVLLYFGLAVFLIGVLIIDYKLVKYGIKNDLLWPHILAFFLLSGSLAIIFYLFLRDKENRETKEKERKEDREIRLERKQREEN